MPKWLAITFLVIILSAIGSPTAFAAEEIKLSVDGTIVETDVPPVLESGRTLVPYRALLEALGGEVSWNDEAKTAIATLGSYKVQLTIDSMTGFVNGAQKTLEVPARIINGRTLIPVRFVVENLNCAVEWDNETRTVQITSPEMAGATAIRSITLTETDTAWVITAEGDGLIAGTKIFAYEDPERFGVDILNAAYEEGSGAIESDSELFSAVRFAQFDETTVRVVIDLNEKIAGHVSLSEDRTSVCIAFEKERAGEETGSGDVDLSVLPELDWRASGRLVAIDAGHGGTDPGAEGFLDGDHAIWEKEINLPVALRLYELLNAAGVNAELLRDEDVYMTLYSRPEKANALCADLFVSIHNNSSESATPKGTEVHYYNKETDSDYGITSKEFAEYIQTEMASITGLTNRGTRESPKLAILNKSLMPAVIIEGAFLSNESDVTYMITDEYIEDYALAAARGIIEALNASVE